jgi:NRAMP (natural resistance-associated macrophage protein)-like metal ion transporter
MKFIHVGAFFKKLGPGLTTGAADDDPSGIATYSQAGAQTGFSFLWMSLFTYPFMMVAQEMCARIGLVTGKGLAANIREHYPKWLLYLMTILLFAANAFNIGADLGAMAEATRLLFPTLPFALLVLGFTLISLGLQIFLSYHVYSKFLKWMSFALFAYIITAFLIPLDWSEVFSRTVFPRFSFTKDSWVLIAAILGTTISPYLFFWQTSQEVEEKMEHKGVLLNDAPQEEPAEVERAEITDMRVDVFTGMFVSNIVMFFIIVVCASTLFGAGITNITSAADAAAALKPFLGEGSSLIFTLGIIGAGLLAVPILAGSASYAISESLRWKFGLYHKLHEAYAFYGVIAFAMVVGFALNFIGLNPIKALIYSSVANCIVAPLALILIIKIASDKGIMGRYANNRFTTFFGWVLVAIMALASLGILVTLP